MFVIATALEGLQICGPGSSQTAFRGVARVSGSGPLSECGRSCLKVVDPVGLSSRLRTNLAWFDRLSWHSRVAP